MKLLPLLCLLTGLAAPLRAQTTPSQFAGDDRFAAKVTIHAVSQPMAELLGDLTARTGIKMTASRRVAEDKVVLFAHDRPLKDSLETLAAFFGFTWEREGKPGSYTYTLTQDLAHIRAEERELDAEVERAADEIMKELELFREYRALAQEDRKALVTDLQGRAQLERDPTKQEELQTRLSVLRSMERGSYTEIVARFLFGVGRDSLIRYIKSPRSELCWPPTAEDKQMPTQLRDEIYRIVLLQNEKFNNPNRDLNVARMEIGGRPGPHPGIEGGLYAGIRSPSAGSSESGGSFYLPSYSGYEYSIAGDAADPGGRKNDPNLARSVAFKFEAKLPSRTGNRELQPPILAQMLAALEESAPVDLISDCFYSTPAMWRTPTDRPLGEILTTITAQLRHFWSTKSNFITIRARRYAFERSAEPAISQLKRWSKLSDEEAQNLDTLAEIADQPYDKFTTTVSVLSGVGVLDGFFMGTQRNHLIFWHMLSSGQRAAARSERGLSVLSLLPALRSAFVQASTDMLAAEGVQSSNQRIEWTPEELASAVYRVSTTKRTMWGARTQNGYSAVGAADRQAALNHLIKNMPELKLDDVIPTYNATIRFLYCVGERPKLQASLSTPMVWARNR